VIVIVPTPRRAPIGLFGVRVTKQHLKANMRNTQKPLPKDIDPIGRVNLHSLFYTIQGEGPLAGSPAVFIRLSGCNLQCPGCDTEYTGGKQYHPEEIRNAIVSLRMSLKIPKPIIVITGGEPLRQNIDELCSILLDSKYIVQIETNGTLPWPTNWEESLRVLMDPDFHIVCSPKTGRVNKSLMPFISAMKYVVEAGHTNTNGLPTRALQGNVQPWQTLSELPEPVPVYVQPYDAGDDTNDNEKHLKTAVDCCLENGHKLCLQVHKIANLD